MNMAHDPKKLERQRFRFQSWIVRLLLLAYVIYWLLQLSLEG